jgi:hypothetical protein
MPPVTHVREQEEVARLAARWVGHLDRRIRADRTDRQMTNGLTPVALPRTLSSMLRGRAVLIGLIAAIVSACGGGASSVASPTPTPVSVLAQEYKSAADKSNKVIDAVTARVPTDCKTVDPCKADFAQLSQAENAFVGTLRGMKIPSSMEADRRALLDIERRRLSVIDDAAQATTLDQINTDYNSLVSLENTFSDAVDHMRLDLGLPAASSSPIASPST